MSNAKETPLRKRSKSSQILAGVLVNSIYEMKNYPVVLINTVFAPFSFLFLIVLVSRGSLIGPAIAGAFIMTMFQSGMSIQTDLSHLKNDFRLQDMVVSSPTSWVTYLFGIALGEIVYSLPALIVLSVLAHFFLTLSLVGLLQFVAVLFLMFLVSIAIGFTLSTFSSDIVQSFAFSRLISMLFSTIPPVYYPITYIPMPFQYLAYFSPTTYVAQIAQNAAGYLDVSTLTIALDWTVLLVLAMVLFLLAKTKARWRDI
ncbi:MAG: ABC transporter permease [Candidatus Bathyarchaeota archaeon]|nr:ABC transporter permease [Candidatus Bathyarchaeota archaeon]